MKMKNLALGIPIVFLLLVYVFATTSLQLPGILGRAIGSSVTCESKCAGLGYENGYCTDYYYGDGYYGCLGSNTCYYGFLSVDISDTTCTSTYCWCYDHSADYCGSTSTECDSRCLSSGCSATTSTTTTTAATTTSTTTTLGDPQLEISPPTQTVNVGSTFTVDVDVSSMTDLYAVEFGLSFDPTIVQCDSFTKDTNFIGSTIGFDPTIDNTAGTVSGFSVSKMGASGVSGSGTLATLQFTTLASGTSTISFSNVQLLDSTTAQITPTITDGSVTVPAAIVEISPSSSSQAVGTAFDVTVVVSNVGDLFSAQFDLAFNPSLLQCDSFTDGDFLGTTTGFSPSIDNTAGTITGFAKTKIGSTGVSGSGTLATIQFTGLSEGTSALTLSNVQLIDSNTDTITVDTTDASISLEKLGDASGDGSVDILDLGMIGQSWGSSSGDEGYNDSADLNGDGVVNLLDLAIIGQNWGNQY